MSSPVHLVTVLGAVTKCDGISLAAMKIEAQTPADIASLRTQNYNAVLRKRGASPESWVSMPCSANMRRRVLYDALISA